MRKVRKIAISLVMFRAGLQCALHRFSGTLMDRLKKFVLPDVKI